jgi:hypothetical protein
MSLDLDRLRIANAKFIDDAMKIARGEKLPPLPMRKSPWWGWYLLIPDTKLEPPKKPEIEIIGE